MFFKLLAAADVAFIIATANTEVLDGWGKLGAIGILGALLMYLVAWSRSACVSVLLK